jgi:hypothetical protein
VEQVRVPNRAQYLVFGPVEDLPNLVGPKINMFVLRVPAEMWR